MNDTQRIAAIGDHRCDLFSKAKLPLRRCQNHNATIRRDPPTIESGCDLLAGQGWKSESKQPIVCHGGCGRS
jgi:hypothetical protein